MAHESRVDILVIGAGPAGLMCANALAMAGTNVRIIDKCPVKVMVGQADGIQPRTTEVLQSYGLGECLIREGNQLHMGVVYGPGRNGGVECIGRIPRTFGSTKARYPFTGKVEDVFLDSMRARGVKVERPKHPVDIQISEHVSELSHLSSFPVKVTVERLDESNEEGSREIIYAKFVVGADGAHSWIRKALGIEMKCEQTDSIWGVVDMALPETNFPDIHNATVIHSKHGTVLTLPREEDLVRLYVELFAVDTTSPLTGTIDKSRISAEQFISVAKKAFHPFELADPKEIKWWSIYTVRYSVASSYSVRDRVFIVGDACHTHSAHGGQGMNAGITDSHNLAWKLVQVLRGWSSPSLLKTYEQERREYAQDLVNIDKEFAPAFSSYARPDATANDDASKDHVATVVSVFKKLGRFMSGLAVCYSPCAIVDPKHQRCAKNLIVGQRMPFRIFVHAADIRPVEIQDLLPSDFRFKILFFVGVLTEKRITELEVFAEEVGKPTSFLRKYSSDENVATVFDIITIVAGKKNDINYMLVPPLFRPHWTKVLLDDSDMTGTKGGHAYESFGLDPNQITLVVVRPDGHVGTMAPSSAISDLDDFFASFMLPGAAQRLVHRREGVEAKL